MTDQVVQSDYGEGDRAIGTDVIQNLCGLAKPFCLGTVLCENYPRSSLENEVENHQPRNRGQRPVHDHHAKPIRPEKIHDALKNSEARDSDDRPVKVVPDWSGP